MAFPTGWSRKCKLTIQNAQVPGALTDFPVPVLRTNLPDEICDPSGSNNAQTDGGDIRFSSDVTGTAQLACEVVSFGHDTTTGAGDAAVEIHVKVPSVSATVDTDIYIWYNTAGTDSQPAVSDTYGRDAVWSNGYEAVLHLQEAVNNTANGYADSTGNGHDGTGNSMALSESACQMGNGQNFDGSADYITLSGTFDLSAAHTVQAGASTTPAEAIRPLLPALIPPPIRCRYGVMRTAHQTDSDWPTMTAAVMTLFMAPPIQTQQTPILWRQLSMESVPASFM